ncbi:PH domain-containing protein [Halobacillus litoralis]|uniref:PH domain-containing protein n=1 Tax=Halobacillus litoralis TaxID=45668 RepID=A0A845DW21_9BACI|nr:MULTISPECIES: PH domain-containing protein [Halobacillus]MCA1020661.1 PH domain-containing protein [Halobacillus litoralis]MYL20512.1 PH domain-containing protein [Halobacillus litoralis]MYL29603.1 PH domain-containing protein [Halobacillus halophilus]MYL36820.1 PH domain-containing protein [Halobacillus litoralis]
MGFLDGLMGNASEVDVSKLEKDLEDILAGGEQVESGYKVLRDSFIFTNKRLLLVDKQGMTGKKVEYHSIPYKSITHFSVETAGSFDLDSELKIWISGSSEPIGKLFKKDSPIESVQKTLAEHVL